MEECYRKRLIKFNETLMGFVKAKVDRHEGSFEIESFPPEDIVHYMSESPWSIDSGFCYTLRLNELKNEIPMFFLNPNLSYFYVLHDYNYYFHSTNPLMYPRILKNVCSIKKKVLFLKKFFYYQEINLVNQKGLFKWYYIQLIEHKLLDRYGMKCENSPEYNWNKCIYSSFTNKVEHFLSQNNYWVDRHWAKKSVWF